MKQSIVSLAQVIRSKNAGPYELVLDILFKTGNAANLLI